MKVNTVEEEVCLATNSVSAEKSALGFPSKEVVVGSRPEQFHKTRHTGAVADSRESLLRKF